MRLIDLDESNVISEYPSHSHGCFEITLVLQGKVTVFLDGKCEEVSEGDVLIIPPNTTHLGSCGSGYMDVFIHASDMDFYDTAIVHDHDKSIRSVFFMIKKLLSERETNYLNISDKLLDALSEYIKKYLEKDFKYDFVVKLKNKIYENVANPAFDISAEIKKLGFNIDYFRRCFREELSCTPLEYMTRLKMERAKKLLVQRAFQSVEKVSSLCGFSDNFYFSKIFKKHTGLSPREYRKVNFTE